MIIILLFYIELFPNKLLPFVLQLFCFLFWFLLSISKLIDFFCLGSVTFLYSFFLHFSSIFVFVSNFTDLSDGFMNSIVGWRVPRSKQKWIRKNITLIRYNMHYKVIKGLNHFFKFFVMIIWVIKIFSFI